MKIFISGPMSGKPNGNKEAFDYAEAVLKEMGVSVFNPAWCQYDKVTEFTKDDMHAVDFAALERCNAIFMLKGWQYSKGARAEYCYAKAHGLKIFGDYRAVEESLAWNKWKNNLPDRLDITSKHPRVMKPIDDCFSMYDYIGPNTPDYQLEAIKENVKEQYNNIDKRISSFAESYTVNLTNLRKEVESIKESIGTDNLQEQLEKDFSDVYTEFQSTKDKVNEIEFSNIDMSCKMSSAIAEMTKVKETVKGLNSLVATLGERNEVLSDKLESGIEENRHYRLSVTEQLGTIRSRLKAIEKRLSIKPFYAPTEDEKDDD